MKKRAFDFRALGESLRADTQDFLDTYGTNHPEDGPIIAFCLYFDSQLDGAGIVLPQKAVAQGIDIADTATWYQYADHIQAEHSEQTLELLSQYEEWFDEDRSDDEQEAVVEQFHQMITWVIQHLTFDKLPKTDDFVFYAEGMDEDYEAWDATIPPALLKKHFNQ